ncbi:PQQ-binding-like beta-propeller repeat protein [Streptomyces sp. NBC_00059]|uniref:PQQ-binding-like beta-propeller repeat protein n=1 Tax=Streptomyces sp. NBC_00059 TaxID=2975635 RepID=UPI00225854BC|nr:PQQ-binding-like beta-propeller repeat protein [Streptomyces sp. NBC_00059]MCX5417410.1 PQQ-like beta-propeller repeat protein [Streptomyces sp. NBC_00059]
MNPARNVMPGSTSRRRLLRAAASGAGLALLGAGAVGCDDSEGGATRSEDKKPAAGGGSSAPADGQAPAPLWQVTTTAKAYGGDDALVVVDGVVIAVGDPLVGWDAATGKKRWSREGVTVPGAPLLVGKGRLYLASGQYDGNIIALDPATGQEVWRSRLGNGFAHPRPVAVDDTAVYMVATIIEDGVRTKTNVIAAIDSTSGKVLWREQRDTGTEENGISASVRGKTLVYTDFRKNLTVRDTATGKQVWTQKLGRTNYDRFAVHEDLVIVSQGRDLRAFALADGAEKWTLRTEEFTNFQPPSVLEGVLYVSDSSHAQWAVDPATGRKIWHRPVPADEQAAAAWQFAQSGGTLFGATDLDEHGGVHAFDTRTGARRWTYNDKSGALDAWYVAAEGKRVFALHDEKLTALPAS